MLEDTNTGISWVLRHAGAFGGDGRQVYLVGQSAGGQLGALTLLAQVAAAEGGGGDGVAQAATAATVLGASPRWDPRRVRAFCGVSGAYNLFALADHLHRRGLYRHMFEAIHSLAGRPMLRELSPTLFARHRLAPAAAAACPPMLILHGTADKSVPVEIAVEFVAALQVGALWVGREPGAPSVPPQRQRGGMRKGRKCGWCIAWQRGR